MGGSEPARFLITQNSAQAWAPIRPEGELPVHVTMQPTSVRKRRDWIVDVIVSPPKAPFLAASVGMSGADAKYWRLTTSENLIAFGGAASLFEGQNLVLVDREKFLLARDWFVDGDKPVSDLLNYWQTRQKFKTSLINGKQARARIDRIKTDEATLRSYPGEESLVIAKLASYAANIWEAEVSQ